MRWGGGGGGLLVFWCYFQTPQRRKLIRIKNKETKVVKVAYLFDHEVAI